MTNGEFIIKSIQNDSVLSQLTITIRKNFLGYRKTSLPNKTELCTCIELNQSNTYGYNEYGDYCSEPNPCWDIALYIFDEGNDWWNIIEGMGRCSNSLKNYVICMLSDNSGTPWYCETGFNRCKSQEITKEQICVT